MDETCYAESTKKGIIKHLKSFFFFLYDELYEGCDIPKSHRIPRHTVSDLGKPLFRPSSLRKKLWRALSKKEIAVFLEALENQYAFEELIVCRLLLYAGESTAPDDVLNIDISAIDKEQKTVNVSERKIPCYHNLFELFDAFVDYRNTRVFTISKSKLLNTIRRVGEEVGIHDATPLMLSNTLLNLARGDRVLLTTLS